MNKGELIYTMAPFTDDIELYVCTNEATNVPVKEAIYEMYPAGVGAIKLLAPTKTGHFASFSLTWNFESLEEVKDFVNADPERLGKSVQAEIHNRMGAELVRHLRVEGT